MAQVSTQDFKNGITLDLDDPYHGDFVVDWARFDKTALQMEQSHCNGEPLPKP